MKKKKLKLLMCFSVIAAVMLVFNGCALVVQKGRKSDLEKIERLQNELSELSSAKNVLERKLVKEIKNDKVELDMQERGLVITVLAEVLFDSGEAKLREQSYEMLDKVIEVFKEDLRAHDIGIEGHTDNVPIKHSGWKSNWELSSHRALSVLHCLENKGISPKRLSAIGYGKYRPVASNETEQGRQLNRRVEIVVLPNKVKKLDLEPSELQEKAEETKIFK